MSTPLDLALTRARETAEPEERVEHLVAAWRLSRDPALADLIDAHLEALAAQRPPVGAADDSFHGAWLQLAAKRKTADLGPLFAAIARGTGPHCRVRVEALAQFGPHPVVARVLTSWFEQAPFDGKNRARCLGPALELVKQCADPRSTATLSRVTTPEQRARTVFVVGMKNWVPLKALAAEAKKWSVTVPLGALEGFTSPERARPKADLSALWSAVFDAPHDVQRKLVLADALQEQGDPRGEFISLQCTRAPDARPSKREKELLAQYRDVFLGSLAPTLTSPEYEGGLVVGGKVPQHARNVSSTLNSPEWRAVKRLRFPTYPMPGFHQLLGNPLLANLEAVYGAPSEVVLAALEAGGVRPWKHLELELYTEGVVPWLVSYEAKLPHVRVLTVPEVHLEGLLQSRLGRQLTRVGMYWQVEAVPQVTVLARDTKLERLVLDSLHVLTCFDVATRALRLWVGASHVPKFPLPRDVASIEVINPDGRPPGFLESARAIAPTTVTKGRRPEMTELLSR